jgi:hypothetical protein
MSQQIRICGCMGCRRAATVTVKHDKYGRRTVCEKHAEGQMVIADV